MEIFKIVVLAGCLACVFGTVRGNADPDGHPISGLRMAHRQGPSQTVGTRWGWTVRASRQGSVVQRTPDGGRSWEDRTPPGFTHSAPDLSDGDVADSSVGLSALDSQQCWVAFGGGIQDRNTITVEHTADGGRHWHQRAFAGEADAVILQFLDVRHGFLLALGSPAAGLMQKDFYRTSDGGKTWTRGGSPEIGDNYYPSGMAFRNNREGWITGSNHGVAAVPFVRTRDGGRTWRLQPIPLPPSYPEAHGDASQPRFIGRSRLRGAFTARLRNNDPEMEQTVTYLTHDGGKHWQIAEAVRRRPH